MRRAQIAGDGTEMQRPQERFEGLHRCAQIDGHVDQPLLALLRRDHNFLELRDFRFGGVALRSVYRQSKDLMTVTVLQEAVRVEKRAGSDPGALGTSGDGPAQPEATALMLKAGEQAISRHAAVVSKTAISQAADVVAWRQRQLVFRDVPLSKVVSEFNRYNQRQIILEGDVGENRHITGTFTAEKPESLLEFLKRDRQLQLSEQEDALVVSEAK